MNAIEVNGVWKKFRKGEKLNSLRDFIPHFVKGKLSWNNRQKDMLGIQEFWALKDLNFEVKKGEVLGIIGPNGAGKSTILKLLFKLMQPNKGHIAIRGKISGLIEITAGFHSELTGRENVYLNGTILGMKKKEIDSKFEQIVEFSGVREFIDTPVKRYSSGMFARLGFSVVAHMNPEILLVDEVLAVGDMAFQAKCSQKMRELLNSGATIVLVSHNLSLVQNLCKRTILLDKGKVLREGKPGEVIPYYQQTIQKQQVDDLKKGISTREYHLQVTEDTLINIENVLFYDENHNYQDKFLINKSFFADVIYEAKKKIENPVFVFEIIRPDGILCCYSNTKDSNLVLDCIEGKGKIQIQLDEVNLIPGVYLFKIAVWDKEMVNTYVFRKEDVFRIESPSSRIHYGVFIPKIKWSIDVKV